VPPPVPAEQPEPGARSWGGGKAGLLAGIVAGITLVDLLTKLAVLHHFRLYQQVNVVGDFVRLTFIENSGAAFGIRLGAYDRQVFLVLSLVALAALAAMYWATPLRDRLRLLGIAIICGGALGNLLDRIRSPRGVVDFIDVGIGNLRWPIFNVADIAVTTGAVLLALSLWREERGRGRPGP
jgi:signal peptidase II